MSSVYDVEESSGGVKFYSVQKWSGFDVSHIDFNVEGNYRCPACEYIGADRKGDNLRVFGLDRNGEPLGAKCFKEDHFNIPSMNYIVESGGESKIGEKKLSVKNNTVRNRVKVLPKDFKDLIISDSKRDEIIATTTDTLNVKYRGLQRYNDVSQKNGIRYKIVDDKVTEMYTPFYHFDGEKNILTGYQVRVVGTKQFFTVGYANTDINDFVGKSFNTKVADALIIVGGAVDYVTTQGAINDLMQRYKTHSINVVSTVTGEQSCASSIRADYDWVVAHKKIILALDNDDAGWKAIDDALSVLPSEQCFTANFGNFKDPAEFKLDSQALASAVYWDVQSVDDVGIIGSGELYQSALDSLDEGQGIPLPYYLKDITSRVPYIPYGSIVLFAGETSGGKTTLLSELQFSLIMNSGERTGILSFEDNQKQFAKKVANRVIGTKLQNLPQDKAKELLVKHESEIKKLLADENGRDRFKIVEDGFSDPESAKKVIKKLIKVFECKVIVIDPVQNLIGSKSLEVQRDFMLFLEEMKRIHDVIFILGTHIRKVDKKVDKDGNPVHGAQYGESDIEGSGAITKSATLTIALFRDKTAQDDIEKNTTTIAIFKNREFSETTNMACKVFYRKSCHRLYPYSDAQKHSFFINDVMGEVYADDIGFKLASDIDVISDTNESFEVGEDLVEQVYEDSESSVELGW